MWFTPEELAALGAVIWWAVKQAVQEWLAPLTEKIESLWSIQQQNSEERQLTEEEVVQLMPKEVPYFVIMKSASVDSASKDTRPLKEQWPHSNMEFNSSANAQEYLDANLPNARDQRLCSIVERIRYE